LNEVVQPNEVRAGSRSWASPSPEFEKLDALLYFWVDCLKRYADFSIFRYTLTMKDFRAGRPMKTPQGYTAFMPERIDRAYRLDDPKLQGLVEQATLKLGVLDAFG